MLFAPIAPRGSDARAGVPTQGGQTLQQDEKAYTLRFDMPGISREQLKISIEDAVVRIETAAEAPRQYRGAYELPQAIDATASTATLENGVLTLQLVKLQPVSRATTLTVQ
jgi:HSP20 family molecular chaperone IbpA